MDNNEGEEAATETDDAASRAISVDGEGTKEGMLGRGGTPRAVRKGGHACEGRHWKCMGVRVAERQDIKCVQECTGMHGGTWVSTWVMHNARGAHGGPSINEAQMYGSVRSYQVQFKVQGEAGYACGRMKCARGCMEVHAGQIQQVPQGSCGCIPRASHKDT